MSKLLFKLRGVPEDEADDIRELLTENNVDFYETSPGNWGFSMPGIWLNDEDAFENARALIDEYQKKRVVSAREEVARLKSEGKNRTFLDWVKEKPASFIFYIMIIGAVLYLQYLLVASLGE